ncbi:MAG: glucan biosynthesis protein G [Hyphomicrobiaceae bacterium]|nr:glucan biosynthesis protein G [Hyphomicrobiaceae bacterium]
MARSGLDRRTVIRTGGGWALAGGLLSLAAGGAPALAQADVQPDAVAFTPDAVKRAAQQLAQRPFSKPRLELPEPFDKLTYDQYRDIRFRKEQAIWRGGKLDYELQLFPLGYLYDAPVEIWLVQAGRGRPLKADGTLFSIGPQIPNPPQSAPFGFSGFRVHGPINRSDVMDEYVVFQGASYYRAVGRGQLYGLSARGLAINTAKPPGEEFPLFRSFWIEKPEPGAPEIVVHALLDSTSTTGAYRFAIQPGSATVMDVEATLYPRREIPHVGLAPLTSMFLHGSAHKRVGNDFRPAVHDSEGLAILNGNGERIWRPLTNPKLLQVSAFIDKDPKGFGLAQRDRAFSSFEDLEAHYERRPTVWVEPRGGWGEGYVELIEIPADEEIHDNIVAFWRPAKAIEAGKELAFAYRLHWGEAIPVAWTGARVRKTRRGGNGKKGVVLFVVDFDGPALKDAVDLPVADVAASAGTISNATVQRHPAIGGVRCSFELQTASADLIELRLVLKDNERTMSESWLYRWTR